MWPGGKERLQQIWGDWLEIELLSGNGPRIRRCKAIGIDKEEEEDHSIACVLPPHIKRYGVCRSVRTYQRGSHWTDLHENWCWGIWKSVAKFQNWLKFDKNIGHFNENLSRFYCCRWLQIAMKALSSGNMSQCYFEVALLVFGRNYTAETKSHFPVVQENQSQFCKMTPVIAQC
jgi:hypothetical protein